MKFAIEPERVYVVGAVDFWMQRGAWPEFAKKREQRVRDAYNRKYAEKIERERKLIAKMESAVQELMDKRLAS